MFRRLHLSIAKAILKLLQSLGLLIWKVNFSDESVSKMALARPSVAIGVIIFTIIILFMGKQLMLPIPTFETIYTTDVAVLTRIMMRIVAYAKVPCVFLPIWMMSNKIKGIYKKLLRIRVILKDINEEVGQEFIGARITWFLFGCLSFVFMLMIPLMFLKAWANVGIVTFVAVLYPHFYGLFSLVHFAILHGMISKRLCQVTDVLSKVAR